MLLEFSFSNFRSFKDSATVSMLPAKLSSSKELSDVDKKNLNLCKSTKETALRISAVYGANGSGKSNIIKALRFMKNFVLNSSRAGQSGDDIPTEPFLLDFNSVSSPSGFEVVFIAEGVKYRYGFEVTNKEIVSEWLYYVPSKRETMIYDRNKSDYKISGKYNDGFRGLEKSTRKNALFISVLAQFNDTLAEIILDWFADINFVEPNIGSTIINPEWGAFANESMRERLNIILESFDTGVKRIIYKEKPWEDFPVFTAVPDEVKKYFRSSAAKLNSIKTVHEVYDEDDNVISEVEFDLDLHESDGTKKLISLLPAFIISALMGEIAVIDEMDARLHPEITSMLIELFRNPEISNCAQLIFTTHDTNILTKEIFRRDQIWFVEKNKKGASDLYSLAEIQSRNDANYEKDYLQGRYGAIPFINKAKLMEIR